MSASSPKENATAPEESSSPPAGAAGHPPAATGKSGETDPLIGRVISDRFRILSPIARGGMGVVYKAEQAPLGRLVAIKILSLKHDEEKDPEFRKRFFLEAATVAKLTHPNTVTVFDYGQGDGGIYYIAMELVNGRTLKKALSQEGAFAPERAIHVAKQICRSLREAHRLGVIHRDMKPGNVMLVDRDGEDYVKVLDFGLVKELDPENPDDDLTQAGVFMGSPKYMSPEQIQGEHVDGRTDIYAIGVMLYEMLTGRVPFNRDNQMQILMDHVREPVPPMTVPAGKPPIPPELQAVVLKCLEKRPADRYPDMEALLVALKQGGGESLGVTSSSREVDLAMSSVGTPISGIHTVGPHSPAVGIPTGSVPPGALVAAPAEKKSAAPMLIAGLAVLAAVGGIGAWATGLLGSTEASAPTALAPIDRPAASDSAPAGSGPVEAPPGEVPGATATSVVETAPEAQPEAPIRTLMVSLRSHPSGATVRIGDHEYGPTPAQVELVGELAEEGRELELVFSRPGYRSATVTQVVHGDAMEVDARLVFIRRGGGGGGSSGGGGSDPGVTQVEGYRDSPY